jgi:glycosyltransferase 2 family protein
MHSGAGREEGPGEAEGSAVRRSPVLRIAVLCGLGGVALATMLILRQGFDAVFATLAAAGFGLIWASLFHVLPMLLNAQAWRILLAGKRRPSLAFFTWTVWAREAVNGLLPVARIGGEVVSVRLLTQQGIRSAPAVASLVVDMTLSIGTQFIFTMLGLALLIGRTGDLALAGSLALGLVATVPIVIAFFAVQRYGIFALFARICRSLLGDRLGALAGKAVNLDRAIRVVYRRPQRVLRCSLWQLSGWVATSGEIWLVLYFFGHPISVWDALLIESVTQAISSAAFVVPAAIGVQEGGFLVIGGLVGLPPETALALALARRARDLLLFVPALLAWQVKEGWSLLMSPAI